MTAGSLKVVFDTNILVFRSLLEGASDRCLLAAEAGLATLVLSNPILTEFGETLTSKFGVSKSEADPILERWAMRAEVARTEGKAGWVLQDPDDDKFVETALVGGATIIV
jgi:predicted nucleic acid-binding protein